NAFDFVLETLPAMAVAVPFLVARQTNSERPVRRNFVLALGCYAFACTFVVLFWPAEVNPRYILPMVPPLCVLGGLAYDPLSEKSPSLIAADICVIVALLAYAGVHAFGDAVFTPAYSSSKRDGARITELVRGAPARLYRTDVSAGMNQLPYVPYAVSTVGID